MTVHVGDSKLVITTEPKKNSCEDRYLPEDIGINLKHEIYFIINTMDF